MRIFNFFKAKFLIISIVYIGLGLLSCTSNRLYHTNTDTENTLLLFVGSWKGDLKLWPLIGAPSTLTMTLDILPTSDKKRYQWNIRYQDQDTRTYSIIIEDIKKGTFSLDENNGIVIPMRMYENKIVSIYEVSQNALVISYEIIEKNKLAFEVIAYRPQQFESTGGKDIDGEQIPIVKTFIPHVFQRGILHKYNPKNSSKLH